MRTGMRRAARAGFSAVTLWLAAASGVAWAGTPVGIYPPQAMGLSPAEVSDLRDLLASAVRTASHRRGALSPASPLQLGLACGPAPLDGCLADQAKGGAVLVSKATRRPVGIVVTLALVDAAGRRTKPEAFVADLAIQNLAPADRALSLLEFSLGQPPASSPAAAATAAAAKAATAAAPPSALAARPPPSDAFRLVEPATPPGRPWQDKAGNWCFYGGLAALAGGVTFGVLGKQLSDDLGQKAATGSLTRADAASYDKVDTYGLVATSLLVAGGISTATGLVFWSIAPEVKPVRAGAVVGVSGRFP